MRFWSTIVDLRWKFEDFGTISTNFGTLAMNFNEFDEIWEQFSPILEHNCWFMMKIGWISINLVNFEMIFTNFATLPDCIKLVINMNMNIWQGPLIMIKVDWIWCGCVVNGRFHCSGGKFPRRCSSTASEKQLVKAIAEMEKEIIDLPPTTSSRNNTNNTNNSSNKNNGWISWISLSFKWNEYWGLLQLR